MTDPRTILILGAGLMQIPAIKTAKSMGLYTITADANSEAEGRCIADEFVHVDLKDKEGMCAGAESIKERRGLHAVFTAGTDFSSTVAFVAEKLGLPGIPYEAARNASEKNRMRKIFAASGIASPRFIEIDSEAECAAAGVLAFPLVVKPVDNMGARGVVRVGNTEQLKKAVSKALPFSRSGRVIVEEFIEGPEFSIDALVYRGELQIYGFADRHIFFPPYFIEMGHTIPSIVDKQKKEEMAAVFKTAVKALGITNGAAKGDVFYSRSGPVIGEIAARLSGGYMSGWTFPYASGINLTAGAIRIALGEAPSLPPEHYRFVSAERAFISIPGRVGDIIGVEKAANTPNVRECFLRIKKNDPLRFPQNNVEKCGNIISIGKNREEAVTAAQTALKQIFIRLQTRRLETDRWLSGKIDSGFFSAFQLKGVCLQHDYNQIPVYHPDFPRTYLSKKDGFHIYDLHGVIEEADSCWEAMNIGDCIETVKNYHKIDFISSYDVPGIGKVFWKALFAGGRQGAMYLLDSLYEAESLVDIETILNGIVCGNH